jgi:hypothetical protein
MNINLGMMGLIGWCIFFGFIVYYIIFRAPDSDIVCTADTMAEIEDLKKYLAANKIITYTKNKPDYLMISDTIPWTPSLHVLDPKDRDKAIKLINTRTKKG